MHVWQVLVVGSPTQFIARKKKSTTIMPQEYLKQPNTHPPTRHTTPSDKNLAFKKLRRGKAFREGKRAFNQNYAVKIGSDAVKRTNYHFVGVHLSSFFLYHTY